MAKTRTNLQIQNNQTPQLTLTNNKLKLCLSDMKTIKPLTDNQKGFFDAYEKSKVSLLHGVAGTGKTYIALYLETKKKKQKYILHLMWKFVKTYLIDQTHIQDL